MSVQPCEARRVGGRPVYHLELVDKCHFELPSHCRLGPKRPVERNAGQPLAEEFRVRNERRTVSTTPVRYAFVRTLRTWLWLIVAVAAPAGGVTAFLVVYESVESDFAIGAASGAAVVGAILAATHT
jgi:hypothetical protein